MNKVMIVEVNVRSFLNSGKVHAAQDQINEYIWKYNLDVISTSLFIKDENMYIFTLTLR